MRAALICGCVSLFIAFTDALADGAASCQVHVMRFVPSDARPPTGYQQRVDEIVAYTESFLRRGFKRWGHQNVVMPFRRMANGRVEVTLMRGKAMASEYK